MHRLLYTRLRFAEPHLLAAAGATSVLLLGGLSSTFYPHNHRDGGAKKDHRCITLCDSSRGTPASSLGGGDATDNHGPSSRIGRTDAEANKSRADAGGGGKVGKDDDGTSFHGLFPKSQAWHPRVPYPLWDDGWEGGGGGGGGRNPHRRGGVTRHIILIRHGQYDETHEDDSRRRLTDLGRRQAELTGDRLAEIVRGVEHEARCGPCDVKLLCVSDMTRAKETADIIARRIGPGVRKADPDPLLNEGIPAHPIPTRFDPPLVDDVAEGHPRIEKAFQKYVCRSRWLEHEEEMAAADATAIGGADPPRGTSRYRADEEERRKWGFAASTEEPPPGTGSDDTGNRHEFEIIVCHGNVIRYFFCRALQLPPEAWLRMSVFNCSLTYLMVKSTGTASCRMLGDIGHLGYGNSTFSMNHGFQWE